VGKDDNNAAQGSIKVYSSRTYTGCWHGSLHVSTLVLLDDMNDKCMNCMNEDAAASWATRPQALSQGQFSKCTKSQWVPSSKASSANGVDASQAVLLSA
jgi:hypothetical protein